MLYYENVVVYFIMNKVNLNNFAISGAIKSKNLNIKCK